MTFLDTNVIVYVFDEGEPRKQAIAASALAAERPAVISTQVIREFYSVCRGKLGRPHDAVRRDIRALSKLRVASLSPESLLKAVDMVPRHSLSIWDATIVRAAHEAGCERILTEDMADGAVIEGVRIENPFAGV